MAKKPEPTIRLVPISTILGTTILLVGALFAVVNLICFVLWAFGPDHGSEPILDDSVPRELVSSTGPVQLKKGRFSDAVYWIDGTAPEDEIAVEFGTFESLGGAYEVYNSFLDIGGVRVVGSSPTVSYPFAERYHGSTQTVTAVKSYKITPQELPFGQLLDAHALVSFHYPYPAGGLKWSLRRKSFEHKFRVYVINSEAKKSVERYEEFIRQKNGATLLVKSVSINGIVILFGVILYRMRVGPRFPCA